MYLEGFGIILPKRPTFRGKFRFSQSQWSGNFWWINVWRETDGNLQYMRRRAIVTRKFADQLAQVRKQCGYKTATSQIQAWLWMWFLARPWSTARRVGKKSIQVEPQNLSVCSVEPSEDSEELVLRDSIQIGEETWGLYVLKDPGEQNQPISMELRKIKWIAIVKNTWDASAVFV